MPHKSASCVTIRLQIERYVERETVITGTAPNAQADAGELGGTDIDAGCLPRAARGDAQLARVSDDRVFERHHQLPHAHRVAP
jgi:hypothetical protein